MDIVSLAETYGVKNLRFFIPMHPLEMFGFIPGIGFKSSDTPTEIVECEIDESRYQVADDYKITLKAIENHESGSKLFGKEHFYITDLENLIERSDEFRVFVLTIDGYCEIKH